MPVTMMMFEPQPEVTELWWKTYSRRKKLISAMFAFRMRIAIFREKRFSQKNLTPQETQAMIVKTGCPTLLLEVLLAIRDVRQSSWRMLADRVASFPEFAVVLHLLLRRDVGFLSIHQFLPM